MSPVEWRELLSPRGLEDTRGALQGLSNMLFHLDLTDFKALIPGRGGNVVLEDFPMRLDTEFCTERFSLIMPLLVGPAHLPPLAHSSCSGSVSGGVQPHRDRDVWR